MKYECVYETNPLLPRKPSTTEILELKGLALGWIPIVTSDIRYSDQVFAPANKLMIAVVINNLAVLDRVKNNKDCQKTTKRK